jgi:hypothetical protein
VGRRHCSSFSLALPELALEYLSRRIARQAVDELDESQRFIIGDARTGPIYSFPQAGNLPLVGSAQRRQFPSMCLL